MIEDTANTGGEDCHGFPWKPSYTSKNFAVIFFSPSITFLPHIPPYGCDNRSEPARHPPVGSQAYGVRLIHCPVSSLFRLVT